MTQQLTKARITAVDTHDDIRFPISRWRWGSDALRPHRAGAALGGTLAGLGALRRAPADGCQPRRPGRPGSRARHRSRDDRPGAVHGPLRPRVKLRPPSDDVAKLIRAEQDLPAPS